MCLEFRDIDETIKPEAIPGYLEGTERTALASFDLHGLDKLLKTDRVAFYERKDTGSFGNGGKFLKGGAITDGYPAAVVKKNLDHCFKHYRMGYDRGLRGFGTEKVGLKKDRVTGFQGGETHPRFFENTFQLILDCS